MNIGIYSRLLKKEHRPFIQELFKLLAEKNYNIFIYDEYLKSLKTELKFLSQYDAFATYEDVKKLELDLLISLGGDGTLLDTVGLVRDSGIPVAGVNMGRLGFLADIHKEEISSLINAIEQNTYTIEDRSLIHIETNKPLFGDNNFGLNEFSILKTEYSSMITIHVYLNGEFLSTYWADGLIVATPTGSTAYSLSCGGPIIFPDAGNFVLTPIAPHNLNARPIVIPDNTVVSFEVECRSKYFLCAIDSRNKKADKSFQIAIRKEQFPFKLFRMPENHYLKTLREKLNWGEDARN